MRAEVRHKHPWLGRSGGALLLGAALLLAGCGPATANRPGAAGATKSSGSSGTLVVTGGTQCATGLQGTQYNVVAPRVGAEAVATPTAPCWNQIALTPFYNEFFNALPKGKTPQDYGGFKTAYSSKYLFVDVQVNDWPLMDNLKLPIYEVSEVEIGVGPDDRSGPFTAQTGYGQYTFDGKNGIVQIYGPAHPAKYPSRWLSTVTQGKGYTAEAIIPLADIGVPAEPGSIIGLSVGTNIPVPPLGNRGFVLWAGVFGFWASDANWGTITLG